MTRKTALDLGIANVGSRGNQRLYRMDPPLKDFDYIEEVGVEHEYVIASAVDVFGEPETYLFPSNADGEVTSWGELPGSMKGTLNHEEALANAGYEVIWL